MSPIEQVFLQVRLLSGNWTPYVHAATNAVSRADRTEIADWFTAPEMELLLQCDPLNLFFHPLPSGHYALGVIYSARRSFFTFIQQPIAINVRVLIISPQSFLAYHNHPIALFEMLQRQHLIPILSHPPQQLAPLLPAVPALPLNLPLLETLAKHPGAMSLAQLMQSLFNAECTLFSSKSVSALSVLSAIFDLLPIQYRPELTFSTNIFFSRNNSFRLSGVSSQRQRTLQLMKRLKIPMLSLEQEHKGSLETLDPWARFIYLLLQSRNFDFWKRYQNKEYQAALLSSTSEESQPIIWSNLHEIGVALSKAILSGTLPNQHVSATDVPIRTLEELRCIAAVDQLIPMIPAQKTADVKLKNHQRLAERFPLFRNELTTLEAYIVRAIFGDESVQQNIQKVWVQLTPKLDRETKEIILEEIITTIHAVLVSIDGESGKRLRRSSQLLNLMVFFLQVNA